VEEEKEKEEIIYDASAEIGIIPEQAVFIGEKKVEHLSIDIIEYGANEYKEYGVDDIREVLPLNGNVVSWINVVGIHDDEQVKEIGALFDIHPLVIEDVLNTHQRPKMEDFDYYLFAITKMLSYKGEEIINEQVSIILGKNFVLTFQEIKMDVFEYVRHRIRKKKGRIYRSGADYLAYLLIDAVVENYVLITERIGEKIEDLEDGVLESGNSDNLVDLMTFLKRELNQLRRIFRPTSEFILQMNSSDSDLIDEDTKPFFKDLLDISVRSNEAIETCRDMLSDNLQIYNLDVANRFNETLRFLTVFSALFAPLTFIAGVYGMNFKNMPEIENWNYGYLTVWAVMILIVVVMFVYFRKRKWI
jgi:magnesium transporter